MEILVCLKQVPDDSVEIHLKPGTEEVNLDGVTPVVNAFDTYALEMATRLKEAVGGTHHRHHRGPGESPGRGEDLPGRGRQPGLCHQRPHF